MPLIDSDGALRFWYTHGIISEDSYHGALKYCDLTEHEPLQEANNNDEDEDAPVFSNRKLKGRDLGLYSFAESEETDNIDRKVDREKCEDYIIQAMDEMAGINIYDIYADVCINEQQQRERTARSNNINNNHNQYAFTNSVLNGGVGDVGAFFSSFLKQPPQPRYDPCISNEVELYMNRPDVQAAFNANQTGSGHEQPGPWVTCTPRIAYSRDDVLTSMLPVYDQLLDSGLEFLVYSGDIDAIVPIIGTRKWIRKLNLEVKEKWRAWRSSTGQVAGWTV